MMNDIVRTMYILVRQMLNYERQETRIDSLSFVLYVRHNLAAVDASKKVYFEFINAKLRFDNKTTSLMYEFCSVLDTAPLRIMPK